MRTDRLKMSYLFNLIKRGREKTVFVAHNRFIQWRDHKLFTVFQTEFRANYRYARNGTEKHTKEC
jgi:hypothetical protein